MRKFVLAFLALASVLAFGQHADALQGTLATKQITVNFNVTPSPTPIGYVPASKPSTASFASLIARANESNVLAYDPFLLNDAIAQAAPPQGNVKVQFTVKVDPTFQYFHLIPVATTQNAGYGPNTYTCVFQVFASYPTSWTITDYAYGSNTTGGTPGLNGFPMFNYATTSDLAWLAETVTTSYKAFYNAGTPGETTFLGSAGQSKTICIDLSLTVPSNIPAGSYSATISYRMTHS